MVISLLEIVVTNGKNVTYICFGLDNKLHLSLRTLQGLLEKLASITSRTTFRLLTQASVGSQIIRGCKRADVISRPQVRKPQECAAVPATA